MRQETSTCNPATARLSRNEMAACLILSSFPHSSYLLSYYLLIVLTIYQNDVSFHVMSPQEDMGEYSSVNYLGPVSNLFLKVSVVTLIDIIYVN